MNHPYQQVMPHHFGTPQHTNGIDIVPAALIDPRLIDWIWPGYLATGKLHLLAGAPGTGKTTLAL